MVKKRVNNRETVTKQQKPLHRGGHDIQEYRGKKRMYLQAKCKLRRIEIWECLRTVWKTTRRQGEERLISACEKGIKENSWSITLYLYSNHHHFN